MRVGFQDFVPHVSGTFVHKAESLVDVVARANVWIEADRIDVINVETVAIPSRRGDSEDGIQHEDGMGGTSWHYVLRVWFRAPN